MRFLLTAFFCSALLAAHAQAPVPYLLASGKYQYADKNTGTPAFENVFEFAMPFREGFAVAASQHHQYQLLNTSGKPVSAPWQELSSAPGGYAIAYRTDGSKEILYGGKKIFETKNRLLGGSLSGDLIHFQNAETGKTGVVNFRTGREVLPPKYDHVRPFREGIAAVLTNGFWQFIYLSGQPAFPQQYEDAGIFSEGLAAARMDGKWGFVNQKGAWAIPAQYERVTAFEKGSAFAKTASGWQQIDATGKSLRTLPYQMVIAPAEGMYAFMQNNLWGYADAATGKVVISPQYIRAAPFEDGVALVAKDGLNFYLLPDGRELRAGKGE